MGSPYSHFDDTRTINHDMKTSQSNVNGSSTNLSKINAHKYVKGGYSRGAVPSLENFASFQLPLTPPVSAISTPVNESLNLNQVSSRPWSSEDTRNKPFDFKVRLVVMCVGWYFFSIVSSNTTKLILTEFKYPITLTQLQFSLNICYCIGLFSYLVNSRVDHDSLPKGFMPNTSEINSIAKLLTPTRFIVSTTFPMGIFQLFGHITSHKATSVIPVSMVHIIKTLSPIVTISIYRIAYKVEYKPQIYLSLVPLMAGVMIVSYRPAKVQEASYVAGLFFAFVSMMIFVTQNIFYKKRLTVEESILPKSSISKEKKLDKITMLLYCSIIGFLLTSPIYLLSEVRNVTFSLKSLSISTSILIIFNGLSHFFQALLAFQILGSMSTVNYSIANIMKRIIIIIVAFLFEKRHFASYQIFGLTLTVFGLYSYHRWGAKHSTLQ